MNKSFPQFKLSTSYPHRLKLPKYSSIYIKRGKTVVFVLIYSNMYALLSCIFILFFFVSEPHSNYPIRIIVMGLKLMYFHNK